MSQKYQNVRNPILKIWTKRRETWKVLRAEFYFQNKIVCIAGICKYPNRYYCIHFVYMYEQIITPMLLYSELLAAVDVIHGGSSGTPIFPALWLAEQFWWSKSIWLVHLSVYHLIRALSLCEMQIGNHITLHNHGPISILGV